MISASLIDSKTTNAAASAGMERGRKADFTSLVVVTALFALACTVFFINLGHHPLFNPDEALYAEPAREMLQSGDYVTTYLNYVVRYTKPPLTIWAQAASFLLLGNTEFAARIFSAACGAILVSVTYLFCEKYVNRKAGIIAALSLATAPLFMVSSRLAITDIPLSLFVAASVMSLYHGFCQQEGRWKWIAYVLIGLGVMTKGPVALVLPAGVLGGYHLATGTIRRAWSYYRPIAGLALIGLIAIPWFAIEIYVTRGEYFYAFLVRENFQRFTGVVDHKYGWWYHPLVVAGGFFPWTVFLLALLIPGLAALARKTRWSELAGHLRWSELGSRLSNWRLSLSLEKRTVFLSWCAVLFVVGFFSVSVSKLLPYTLPAFPFLSIALGALLASRTDRDARAPLACAFAVLAVAALAGLFAPALLEHKLRDCPPELLVIIPRAACSLAFISGICIFLSLRSSIRATAAFCTGFLVFLGVFGPPVLDIMADEWERPMVDFVRFAAVSHWPIVIHGMRKPSATFYAGRPVLKPANATAMLQELSRLPEAYIITRKREAGLIGSIPGCKILDTRGAFLLASWKHPQATK